MKRKILYTMPFLLLLVLGIAAAPVIAGSNSNFATHLSGEQDWNVRRIIVMALRHWDEKAVPYLVNALSDGSEYVRRYAAMTLGFKKAFEAGPHLKRLASIDSSKEVRSYARWALEQMKG